MNQVTFSELKVTEPVCKALEEEGYQYPTPIQHKAIPFLLEGRDLIACAQTGTGKTAAFAIPMLQHLSRNFKKTRPKEVRSLILTPTRELAIQIGENFSIYGRNLKLRYATIFGGVSEFSQIRALKNGVDVLIATPGRLLDLTSRNEIDLASVEIFVLDEADRMLDMGFIRDVRKVIPLLPKNRQTLLFSATMPSEVEKLAMSILKNPEKVAVNPVSSTVEKIDERVMFVEKQHKSSLLLDVLKDTAIERVLVFTRTKHGANKLSQQLLNSKIGSAAIHGNKSQGARVRALDEFRNRKIRVLVATDIFARGIDIDDISHVINYELPNEPESYVHRIGRTGRAGKSGIALSFCDREEVGYLREIEKVTRRSVTVVKDHEFKAEGLDKSSRALVNQKKRQHKRSRSKRFVR
jgi:ATP-dependent RNA helicase RhlE